MYDDEFANEVLAALSPLPKNVRFYTKKAIEQLYLEEPVKDVPSLRQTLIEVLGPFSRRIPDDTSGAFYIPAHAFLKPADFGTLRKPFWSSPYFLKFKERFERNQDEVKRKHKVLLPKDHPGNTEEIAFDFFKGTPLLQVLTAQIYFAFPEEDRLEHQIIVAPTGHGKTQALEMQFLSDYDYGCVVIDSKPDMVLRLAEMDLGPKTVLIDPREAPALNLFDVDTDEENINRTTASLSYFFRALLGTELSSTMSVVFRPLIHLMCLTQEANLETFLEALDTPSKFALDKLPPAAQRFFERDYAKIIGKETVNAVKRRIYDISMQSPTFEKMFNAPQNRLDLFSLMQQQKVVLVSTEKNFLQDLSPIFGKYIISQVISAALKRATLKKRLPFFLVIDEAGPYVDDEKTEEMFSTLRSYGVGVTMAFQHFQQLPPRLQMSVKENAAIQMVAGKNRGWFYCAVRGKPEFPVQIPFGILDQLPKKKDYKLWRLLNAERFQPVDTKTAMRVTYDEPDGDLSPGW